MAAATSEPGEPGRRDAYGPETRVIGPGGRFEGLLCFRGAAVIEGVQLGDVVARGRLRIAEGARVQGRIEVDELVVAGTVEGEIQARERVVLASTARVRGRIRSGRLAIEDGGRVEGRCRVGSTVANREESRSAPLQPSVAAAPAG